MRNDNGFTLVEVLIAATVLSVGILAVAAMQINAIGSNSTAMSRTNANAVALAFMEELQRLPFDDVRLAEPAGTTNGAAGLNDGEAPTPGVFPDLINNPPDQSILTEIATNGFLNSFTGLGGNTYRIIGAGTNARIVDEANREYLLFYNIDPNPWGLPLAELPGPFCTIRLFVYWRSPLGGVSHIEYTTTKYNNTVS